MTKEQKPDSRHCEPLSISSDEQGRIAFCELEIILNGQLYILKIATPGYIARLKAHNSTLPEELQLDDNIYPFGSDFSQNQLCQTLSHTPFEQLEPFLREPPKPAG